MFVGLENSEYFAISTAISWIPSSFECNLDSARNLMSRLVKVFSFRVDTAANPVGDVIFLEQVEFVINQVNHADKSTRIFWRG